MKEQYVNNINTHKEVLNALPKNNEKNIKAYKNKVSELLILYKQDLTSIIEEIDKRSKHYLSLGKDEKIDSINTELTSLLTMLSITNKYNSSYEKSGLDKILYQLGHYYTINLDLVNNNILKAIDIFKNVELNITAKDFNYSYYTKKYIKKLLSLDNQKATYNEELKQTFEDIYWKCPDIINHITINFKYLYYFYQKKFDIYYKNKITILTKENLYEKYINLSTRIASMVLDNIVRIVNNAFNSSSSISHFNNGLLLSVVSKAYSILLIAYKLDLNSAFKNHFEKQVRELEILLKKIYPVGR